VDLNVGGLWCPQCGDEYRPGFSECADCRVPLTDQDPRAVVAPGWPGHPEVDEDEVPRQPYTGRIVELGRFPSRFEAEMIVGRLRAAGLRVATPGDDADGWYPHLAFTTGHRVLIAEDDLEAARRLLEWTTALSD
jgi:hypothetical protein